jgi:hypothetical protein
VAFKHQIWHKFINLFGNKNKIRMKKKSQPLSFVILGPPLLIRLTFGSSDNDSFAFILDSILTLETALKTISKLSQPLYIAVNLPVLNT